MSLAENLQSIQQRIAAACARAGRSPESVTLIAVSKTHPPDAVAEAAKLGLLAFGENKVQEAKAKIPLCPGRLRWHMLGHLQSNKCRDAVSLFEMVQSVDSLSLAEELSKRADQASKTLPILLEVNIVGRGQQIRLPAREGPRRVGADQRSAPIGDPWFDDRATVVTYPGKSSPCFPSTA